MERFSILEKPRCIAGYKQGFYAQCQQLGVSPGRLTEFAKRADASAGLGASNALTDLAGITANMLMWLPTAALTGGALVGATTALATTPFEAQYIQEERERKKMNKLLEAATQARMARAKRIAALPPMGRG